MVAKIKAENPDLDEMTIISKLVGYSSDQVGAKTVLFPVILEKNLF